MSRLIDTDVLEKEFCHGCQYENNKYVNCIDCAVANAPTVDAVKVVRCKDCKWWDKKDDTPYGYCMAMKHGFVSSHWEIGIYRTYKGDFFCADGERKDDE